MDVLLEILDTFVLDGLYNHYLPNLERQHILRQSLSLFLITLVFGYALYFTFASLSFSWIYDKEQMKHPRFLKNQIKKEISLSVSSIPVITIFTTPWFVAEVQGYSLLYNRVDTMGWTYLIFSALFFLFFTVGDLAIHLHSFSTHINDFFFFLLSKYKI